MFDLVIRGGKVVTASDTMLADIGIADGVIAAIGSDIGPGKEEIAAHGLLVCPGGVDSHVHCEQRGNARGPHLESFASATTSAAFGGTTSLISFARQVRGEGIAESVAEYHQLASASLIDYSFHMTLTDPTDKVMKEELPALVKAGLRSIKIFMTTHRSRVDDKEILEILAFARSHGVLVVVHAENYAATNYCSEETAQESQSPAVLAALSKPPLVEREAVHRIITFSELLDTPVQIFHVTCREALEEIERAQHRGVKVFAETCPQYLLLNKDFLNGPVEESMKFIFGPPPRTEQDQQALWSAIQRGAIGVVSSDHAPHNLQGKDGKFSKIDGPADAIPHGIPGIETRLPLLFHYGVNGGKIDLNRFVAVTSTNPAKLFGLYPQKGTIAVGSDADLAIWDPELTREITNDTLHHAVDYTPYEGRVTTGWPVITLSRGEILVRNGKLCAQAGRGQWIARNAYPFPLSAVH